MKTNLDRNLGILTITLHCDLTSTTAEQLSPELMTMLAAPAKPEEDWRLFRLELATAKMVDSVGLNLLVGLVKTVQQRGAKMQILCSNPNVQRIFLFTRLDKHVELLKA